MEHISLDRNIQYFKFFMIEKMMGGETENRHDVIWQRQFTVIEDKIS